MSGESNNHLLAPRGRVKKPINTRINYSLQDRNTSREIKYKETHFSYLKFSTKKKGGKFLHMLIPPFYWHFNRLLGRVLSPTDKHYAIGFSRMLKNISHYRLYGRSLIWWFWRHNCNLGLHMHNPFRKDIPGLIYGPVTY